MPNPARSLARLLQRDKRYPLAAYQFLYEALDYAQSKLNFGADAPSEPLPSDVAAPDDPEPEEGDEAHTRKHVSGQELCEAIRRYALEQYGYMAKCVLNSWGIHGTGDFGEIVFNLIRVGQMRKSPHDRREDFNDVFDFEAGLTGAFRITAPE